MSTKIVPPYPNFLDEDGEELKSGYIYIGTYGLNPETNPINVFWDEGLTIPAEQPIRTIDGFPSRSGSAAAMFVNETAYSITTRDKHGSLVRTSLTETNETAALLLDLANTTDVTKGVGLVGQAAHVIQTKATAKTIAPNVTRALIMDGSVWTAVTGASPGTYSDNATAPAFGTIIIPTGGDGSAAWLRTLDNNVVEGRYWGITYGAGTDQATKLQEMINWAAANNRAVNLAGRLVGGIEQILECHSTILIPANRAFTLKSTGINWHFTSDVGSEDGLSFDSCMMTEIDIQGEIVYAGTGNAVSFKPVNNVPVDAVTLIIDSKFKINTVVNTNVVGSNGGVKFDPTLGQITSNVFDFIEINGEGAAGGGGITLYGMLVQNPGVGYGFTDNFISCPHIHNHNGASIQVGVNTTNASAMARNKWNVICMPNATKDGFNTFGVKDCGFVNVTDGVGTPAIGIKLQSTADLNVFESTEIAATLPINETSTAYTNLVKWQKTRVQNGITPGASPYTYQNTSALREKIITTGGTVSAVSFATATSGFVSTGWTYGAIDLEPGDRLQVTYTVAPTMNKLF